MAQRRVFLVFGHIHQLMFAVVVIFIEFSVFGHIQQTMFVVMANFIETFGQVLKVNVRRCQFLVTFTDFGLIHSVIFIRSYSFGQCNNPLFFIVSIDIFLLSNQKKNYKETSFRPPSMVTISVLITQLQIYITMMDLCVAASKFHVQHCYTCPLTCADSSCCLICSVVLILKQKLLSGYQTCALHTMINKYV